MSILVTVIDLCFLWEAKHFIVFKIHTRLSCGLFDWLLGEEKEEFFPTDSSSLGPTRLFLIDNTKSYKSLHNS